MQGYYYYNFKQRISLDYLNLKKNIYFLILFIFVLFVLYMYLDMLFYIVICLSLYYYFIDYLFLFMDIIFLDYFFFRYKIFAKIYTSIREYIYYVLVKSWLTNFMGNFKRIFSQNLGKGKNRINMFLSKFSKEKFVLNMEKLISNTFTFSLQVFYKTFFSLKRLYNKDVILYCGNKFIISFIININ